MGNMFPELGALARAAKEIGNDIAKVKDELEKLVKMIVCDKIIEKKKVKITDDKGKEKETEIEVERDATVEDMISSTLILVLQDEKFRKNVPTSMLQQLMIASNAVRDYERRNLQAILPQIKARVRSDLLTILHKAYPAWQSLVPDATSSMLEAMMHERKQSSKMMSELPFNTIKEF